MHGIVHLALVGELAQCHRKIELEQDVTDIEKKCANHAAACLVSPRAAVKLAGGLRSPATP
ncbi:MAG: hypothetical protein WDN28_20365 [Chthoniobacter sp.]